MILSGCSLISSGFGKFYCGTSRSVTDDTFETSHSINIQNDTLTLSSSFNLPDDSLYSTIDYEFDMELLQDDIYNLIPKEENKEKLQREFKVGYNKQLDVLDIYFNFPTDDQRVDKKFPNPTSRCIRNESKKIDYETVLEYAERIRQNPKTYIDDVYVYSNDNAQVTVGLIPSLYLCQN